DGKKALFLVGKIKPLSPDPDPASPRVRSTIHHALCGLGIFHSCAELVGTIITSRPSIGFLDQDEVVDFRMIERVKKSATLVYKVKRKVRTRVNEFVLDPRSEER